MFQELGSNRPRLLWAFIMTMNYSRLCCVVRTFRQDLSSTIDCLERALEFFGGCPRRVVVDNFKAVVDVADRYTPKFNKTFLEITESADGLILRPLHRGPSLVREEGFLVHAGAPQDFDGRRAVADDRDARINRVIGQ